MRKILIADDSLFMRKVLADILSKNSECKYEIVEADTGEKALKQFKKEKPDLVLLDIIMPEGEEEGLRALQEIIKINPKAQVVMVTAVGQDAIIKNCKKLGARDYITKPFNDKRVIGIVEKYLS